jgi:hypothetical protein
MLRNLGFDPGDELLEALVRGAAIPSEELYSVSYVERDRERDVFEQNRDQSRAPVLRLGAYPVAVRKEGAPRPTDDDASGVAELLVYHLKVAITALEVVVPPDVDSLITQRGSQWSDRREIVAGMT